MKVCRIFLCFIFLATMAKSKTTASSSSSSSLSSSTTRKAITVPTTSKSSTPLSTSTEITKQLQTPTSAVVLCVVLILVIMITVLSVAALVFYKRRSIIPKGPPVENEYANITQDNRLYEEIREGDRRSSSGPAEVISIYATIQCPQPDGAKNKDLFSLTTSPQNKFQDDSEQLRCAEVTLSQNPAIKSAPWVKESDVVYSTPQVDPSTTKDAKDTSPSLNSPAELHP